MRFKRFLLTVGAGFLGAAMLLVGATALGWVGDGGAGGGAGSTAFAAFTPSSGLTPQQIYDANVGSVVEIVTTFPGTTDIFGQTSGGQQGLGSGFVVSKDGYILTNAHVVSQNGQAVSAVEVVFKSSGDQQSSVQGTVVGADESTDVALIKVDTSQTGELRPVRIGDSSAVKVGEQVVAIGNPEGLDFTLTTGVVSATDREMQSPNGSTITGGIQTDAAINPGNSGGPLFDSRGRVIGINEQISTQSGGNEGLGFAVPVNTAVQVMEQMKAGGLQQAQGQGSAPAAGADPYGQSGQGYADPYGQGYSDPYSDPYGQGYGDPYGQGYADPYGQGLGNGVF